jgi:hypothetical protein
MIRAHDCVRLYSNYLPWGSIVEVLKPWKPGGLLVLWVFLPRPYDAELRSLKR